MGVQPVDLDGMIPIPHAHFHIHNAHSLRKSRFGYLLDLGTKKVQAGFACSFREYTCSERANACTQNISLGDVSRECIESLAAICRREVAFRGRTGWITDLARSSTLLCEFRSCVLTNKDSRIG